MGTGVRGGHGWGGLVNLEAKKEPLTRSLLHPSLPALAPQALSELLDLPTDFAPRGPLYAALCALQLQTCVRMGGASPLQEPHDAATATAAAAAAPDAGAAGAAAAAAAAGAGDGGEGGVVARRGRRGAPMGGFRARCGRQREAALAAQARLLDKAMARAAAALQQLSVFDSQLSVMLAEYTPPVALPTATTGAAAAAAASPAAVAPVVEAATPPAARPGQEQERGAAAVAVAPVGVRDLRLVAAAALEPYAVMQLMVGGVGGVYGGGGQEEG